LTGAEQELPKVDGEPREQLCPAQNRSGGGGGNGSGRVYEVEAVVGRGCCRKLCVRWAGWQGQPDELTWEPAKSVEQQVPEVVARWRR
jgi:hypothetical protein